jgi:hypothetical protein
MPDAWQEIQSVAIEYRNSKGFVAASWQDLPVRLCCVSKEIFEVEEALRVFSAVKDDELSLSWRHVSAELADVVLYILNIQHDAGFQAGTPRLAVHVKMQRLATPGELTEQLRLYWSQAFQGWLTNNPSDFRISLEMLLTHTRALFELLQPASSTETIFDACARKLERMATRPALHGRTDPRT